MRQGFSYSYISAWASRCLSSFEGQCEGLKCGVSDKWPRFFCICWFIGFTNTLNINQMNTRRILMLCVWLFAITFMRARGPQAISYQAVARDLTGKVLSEKPISVRVEILQGSNAGTVVYTETHELTTTKTGTINLLIGGGDKVGESDFSTIDWSQSPYFLRLGLKQEKESEYTEVVNTQMLSVPYALYAEKAGSVVNKGEEEPSDGTIQYGRDFVLVGGGDPFESVLFYEMMANDELEVTYNVSETLDISFHMDGIVFSVIYLTNSDLNLTAEIDGMRLHEDYSSKSSISGRSYNFLFMDPNQTQYEFIIKDADGKIVLSHSFNVKFTQGQ